MNIDELNQKINETPSDKELYLERGRFFLESGMTMESESDFHLFISLGGDISLTKTASAIENETSANETVDFEPGVVTGTVESKTKLSKFFRRN
jgi:hypothetical protein